MPSKDAQMWTATEEVEMLRRKSCLTVQFKTDSCLEWEEKEKEKDVSNIFNDTNIRSHEVWLFQRYGQKKTLKTTKEREDVITNCSMRLYLSAEELRELHDFEEDCMDELTRKRIRNQKGGAEDSWLNTLELTELTSQRVNELLQENCSLKSRLCDMEARLDLILRNQVEFTDLYGKRRKIASIDNNGTGRGQRAPEPFARS
ncbi:unnamed protein product [Nippostrongylus brasiliensis]|uniref:Protein kibra n=1 Tax=Nippostrongylus brasiliensis TaxID=27835 RepID=A0A0N4Y410_NIPBR|nr:unnamed protein product [Nippostrongylus brasiliensis]